MQLFFSFFVCSTISTMTAVPAAILLYRLLAGKLGSLT